MGQDRNALREKVPGKAGALAAKAESKIDAKRLSRNVAHVKDEVQATGGKVVARSAGGARLVAAMALRNKVRVAIAAAATAVVAAVVAGGRIVRRRKSS